MVVSQLLPSRTGICLHVGTTMCSSAPTHRWGGVTCGTHGGHERGVCCACAAEAAPPTHATGCVRMLCVIATFAHAQQRWCVAVNYWYDMRYDSR